MSYLQDYGRRLIANGYNITPIKPGTKHPSLTNWTNRNAEEEIDSWLAGPMRDWGVGILTRHNPAIDIDCEDAEVVRNIVRAITAITGRVRAYRIGRAPRVLLIFRTDEPFKKLASSKYEDTLLGTENRIEILGEGQQFAAFHTHPGTGKAYQWPCISPAACASESLTSISLVQAQQIIEAFEAIASKQVRLGRWRVVSESTALANPVTTENWLVSHRTPDATDDAKIHSALEILGADDYDRWLQVGMILHHQYNGDDDGYEAWLEWSRKSEKFAGESDCRYRWERFTSETRASTVTVGTLFHWAEEARGEQASDAMAEVERIIASCDDFHSLLAGHCARAVRQWLDLFPLYRDRVVDLVKRRGRVLSGSPVSIETVRKALKTDRKAKPDESTALYPWAEPYVYVSDDDKFFHREKRIGYTKSAFEAEFGRFLDEDESAAFVALRKAKIPCVEGARYLPGQDSMFTMEGLTYVNRYDPTAGAILPERLSETDKNARSMFAKHVSTLIPREADRRVFIDYLTYVIQNPGKKVNFAILLQGQESDGKSFFAEMMAKILGPSNVNFINGAALEEKYSPWAEGSQICFIEEIKLHGVSGHEILNRFKPYITNETISIRRMQKDIYQAPNVTSYVLFTNYRDALPLSLHDTRYYVIFSRWETPEQLAAWKAANPRFFHELFSSMKENAGSLRKWFLERDISPDFNPEERAPQSSSKAEMARLSRDDVAVHIQDIVENKGGEFGKNEELMSSTWLLWNWNFDGSGLSRPGGRRLATVLMREGWSQVKLRTSDKTETDRISVGNRSHRFWTKLSGGLLLDNSEGEVSGKLITTYETDSPI